MIEEHYERRTFTRMHKDFVAFFQQQSSGVHDMIMIKDLSAGGASFVSANKLDQGDTLKMKINLFPDKPSVDCTARVLRSGTEKSRSLFPTAVQFLDMDVAQQSRIEDLAEAFG